MVICAWCSKERSDKFNDKKDWDLAGAVQTHIVCSGEATRRENDGLCKICGDSMIKYSIFGMYGKCIDKMPNGYPPA